MNYKICFNYNANGHQYITYNNMYLWTSMPPRDTKLIIGNAGAYVLLSRSILVITVQTPTELNIQYLYALNVSDDLPSGLIP